MPTRGSHTLGSPPLMSVIPPYVQVHIDKNLSLRVKLSRLKGDMVKKILVVVF